MITAIDSNILIDVIGHPNEFTTACIDSLDAATRSGALIVCPIVVSETAGWFNSAEQMKATYHRMQIEVLPFDSEDLFQAGQAYIR